MQNKAITTYQKAILLMGVVIGMVLVSCQDRVEVTREYTVYEPVYMSLAEIRSGFEVIAPKTIEERGRIYLYDNWILINDPGNGIHVIDNSNPQSPIARHFIELPGNFSFSVRNDMLYADSYIDLVVIDISNMNDVKEVNRMEGIFQNFNNEYVFDPDSGLIISYEPVRTVTVTLEDAGGHFEDVFSGGFFGMNDAYMLAESSSSIPQPPNNIGVGGSMATYTIVDNFLYALDDSSLHTFDISNESEPVKLNELMLGWDIETLFPYGNNLFVGAQSGMYIINNTNPANPSLITVYSHVVSCDPVVVQGDRAYVTLRSGTNCGGALNQLDVIDISNLSNPTMITAYPMTSPHGLGIDGSTLFICEGNSGLKVFDASDDLKISENMITHITDLDAYDVIPYQNTLYLIGSDGLYQYDYSDPKDLKFISKLEMSSSEL
ncbi:MAG: LVIVD repeat-containing protein [Bacteroidota bacterium]